MSVRMDGRQAVAVVRRAWWLILLLAIVGGTAGYVGSGKADPVYEATTTLLVGDLGDASALTKQDVETTRTLASMYGTLIRRRPVLESVVRELDLQSSWLDLRDRVHVDAGTNDTPVIVVAVSAQTRDEARTIANAIADRAIEIVPAGTGDRGLIDARSFTAAQARSVQRVITAAETRLSRLETAIASAPTPQARSQLRLRIEQEATLVAEWQEVYASLQRAVPRDGSPNTLHVLQTAEAADRRVRPNQAANAAVGAMVGGSLGLGLLHMLGVRRLHRWRHALRKGAEKRVQLSTVLEPSDLGPVSDSRAGAGGASLDPWVRELAGLG